MRVLKKRLFFAASLIALMLTIGTLFYNYEEGWSYVDSFYFSTMTLTTIGYGDLVPSTEGAKIFTSFYALFGIGIMLYVLSSVIGALIFKQERFVSKAFSFLGRFARREKDEKKEDIMKMEKKIKQPVLKKMEKQEKEIEKLKERVSPSIKKIEKQEREIKTLKKKIKKDK